MESMIEMFIGYAISEITESPDTVPIVEFTPPEFCSLRVPESDPTGTSTVKSLPVISTETTRELHELYNHEEDKIYPVYQLEVVIPDLCPVYEKDGVVLNDKREPLQKQWEYKLIDARENKELKNKVTEYPSVICYYFGGSNHSVPHITMGEQVLVFHHKGNDRYYWKEFGRDNELRRLEKYRIFIADQQMVDKIPDTLVRNNHRLHDDNTYYLEFDSINKCILLSTSESDGEGIRYFTKYNCKDHTVALWDTLGNRFELNSDMHQMYMRNADQSKVEINGKDVNIWSQDTINLESDVINIVGRNTVNKIAGVDKTCKPSELSKRLRPPPILIPVIPTYVLVVGNSNFPIYTNNGNYSKVVGNDETTFIYNKVDMINTWMCTVATTYSFFLNKVTVVGKLGAVTYDEISFYVSKGVAYTCPKTIWFGVLTQGPKATMSTVWCHIPGIC